MIPLPEFPPGWYCYILLCTDGTFYCGITSNLARRLRHHASGKGSAYTKGTRPTTLVWYERHDHRHSAALREQQVKAWSHREKEDLVEGRFQVSARAASVWVSLD